MLKQGSFQKVASLCARIETRDIAAIQAVNWSFHLGFLFLQIGFSEIPAPASLNAFKVGVKFKGWPRFIRFSLQQWEKGIDLKEYSFLFKPKGFIRRLLVKILLGLGRPREKIHLLTSAGSQEIFSAKNFLVEGIGEGGKNGF